MQPGNLDQKRSMSRLLLLVVALFILGQLLLPLLLAWMNPLPMTFISSLLLEFLVLLLPASRFIKSNGGRAAFGLRMPANKSALIWAALLGVGAFGLATGINSLMQALWSLLGVSTLNTVELVYMGGGWRMLASFFMIVLVPAVVEEVFFRGALLHAYLPRGRTQAMLHCALLFALLHLNPMSLPAYIVLGLLLSSVTLISGSIYPAILIHGSNNLIAFAISYLAVDAVGATMEQTIMPMYFMIGGGFYIVVGAFILRACYKRFRRAVAQEEHSWRLQNPYQPRGEGHGIFLPPEEPQDMAGEDGVVAATDGLHAADTQPVLQEAAAPATPYAAYDTDGVYTPPVAGAQTIANAAPEDAPRVKGTGRVAGLIAYGLLIIFNVVVLIAAFAA